VWEKHAVRPSGLITHSLRLKESGPVSLQARFKSDQSHLSVTAGFQSHRQANNEEEVMKWTTASGFCCVSERPQLPLKNLWHGQKREGQRWFRKQQGSGPECV